jgi:broad specificity phosphatase PhoE
MFAKLPIFIHRKNEYLNWDFSHVTEEHWWYKPVDQELSTQKDFRPSGFYVCPGEPENIFRNRMIKLKEWISARPEKCILIVAHWGVLKALTGKDMNNCELFSCNLSQLLPDDQLSIE